jgi:hypothetical protein
VSGKANRAVASASGSLAALSLSLSPCPLPPTSLLAMQSGAQDIVDPAIAVRAAIDIIEAAQVEGLLRAPENWIPTRVAPNYPTYVGRAVRGLTAFIQSHGGDSLDRSLQDTTAVGKVSSLSRTPLSLCTGGSDSLFSEGALLTVSSCALCVDYSRQLYAFSLPLLSCPDPFLAS